MNAPLRLEAFVDDELDLAGRLEIERRLADEPALQRRLDELRALRHAVRAADYHAAPEGLRRRLAHALAAPPREPARSRVAAAFARWFDWRAFAGSLALAGLVAVLLGFVWTDATRERRLGDEVVASHVRATLGQHLVDVASSDHHTVKPFLSSKLGFSPPVPELHLAGSALLGGRVDYLDGRPAAALVYQQGRHVVQVFLWPGGEGEGRPRFAAERGYRLAHWSGGGMVHWVISDLNAEEFERVVGALRAAEG